jgi:3-(3-hydroxy-phenyl)propionate hydroxylase
VAGFAQDDTGVDVELSDGQSLRAEYLAGCDGGRSLIRKAAGIEFPGWDPTASSLAAEVEMGEEPEWGSRRDDKGIHSSAGWRTGAGAGRGERTARRANRRADPA